MPKNKLTAREKSRQERERAKSQADRSRQLMKKASQLQEKSHREGSLPEWQSKLGTGSRQGTV